ncbi:Rgp1-domain-containing protein [Catenaria anguillulae PL171]|uniref:Rgp1-domain-containing protein n=1 Tax=Catenaria anguillulae PL171 TaxID=765915 RepID=A0A1Y2HS18_9FUNG|nr:Rgp1-domain-containing protein [Catenaria anguillulae PL171]
MSDHPLQLVQVSASPSPQLQPADLMHVNRVGGDSNNNSLTLQRRLSSSTCASASASSSPSPLSASGSPSASRRRPPAQPSIARPLRSHTHTHTQTQPHSQPNSNSRTVAVVNQGPAPTSISVTVSDAAVFCAGDKLSLKVTIANKYANHNHSSTRSHRPPPRSSSAASFLPSSVSIDSLQLASQPMTTIHASQPLQNSKPGPGAQYSSSRWSWALPSPPTALSDWLSPSANLSTTPVSSQSRSNTSPDKPLMLMLGTIQLVGSMTIDPLSIVPDNLAHLKSIAASTGLTFAQHEYPVFVSAKSILFVNLTLPVGRCTSYAYSTLLPLALPSTVRGGRFIKVAYRAVVECTVSPRLPPIRVICPFRVFSAFEADGATLTYDISEPIVQPREIALTAQIPDPNDPTSKPMSRARSRDDILELLTKLDESLDFASAADDAQMDVLKLKGTNSQPAQAVSPELEYISKIQNGITFRRIDHLLQSAPAVVFDFSSEQGKIAKLKLRRSLYRIGDVITGVVDFREHTIPSLRVNCVDSL